MDRKYAIEELKKFKNYSGISRDKCIEIYNLFKMSPTTFKVAIPHHGELIDIERDEFWDYIKTSDIREVYSTGFIQSLDGECNNEPEDEETLLKLRKQKLAIQDKLNFERKINNKSLRNLNTLEELNKEIIDKLNKLPKVEINRKDIVSSNGSVGIIAIGDVHANELIDTPKNKYDFEILSKRFKKLAIHAKNYFKQNGVNTVVVMLLGDLLNSDRRVSEVFNMATNRSCAVVLLFHVLRQFLMDISEFCNITVASVSGNESRVIGDEFDTSDILATYNYDYTLHEFLKVAFEKDERIKFIDGNFAEKVINIAGSNVLMTHGTSFTKDIEKSVQQTFGRYASNGITLDYLFCGHLHSARIGDMYARTGSMCGGNSYSEGALNLNSRASELIGIFYPDKSNTVSRVDLQDTYNIEGYNIIEELEKYNVKSSSKKEKFLVHIL